MSYRLDFFSPSIDFRHGYGICLHSSIVINSLINPISPLLTRSLIQYIFSLCDSTAINIIQRYSRKCYVAPQVSRRSYGKETDI
ncbi:unnamed protein product [Brassica oleracea var. botrytis]